MGNKLTRNGQDLVWNQELCPLEAGCSPSRTPRASNERPSEQSRPSNRFLSASCWTSNLRSSQTASICSSQSRPSRKRYLGVLSDHRELLFCWPLPVHVAPHAYRRYMCMCICIYAYMQIWTCLHVYVYLSIYIYICACVIYICIYMYILTPY